MKVMVSEAVIDLLCLLDGAPRPPHDTANFQRVVEVVENWNNNKVAFK